METKNFITNPISLTNIEKSPRKSELINPVILRIENIPQLWEENELTQFFSGKANILEANIERDSDTDWSLGKAVMKIDSLKNTMKLIEDFNNKEKIPGANGPLILYIPKEECNRLGIPEMDPKIKQKLQINNIPRTPTEYNLRKIVSQYGKIDSIEINKGIPYSSCTIIFSTPEAAQNAQSNIGLIYRQLAEITNEEPKKEFRSEPVPLAPLIQNYPNEQILQRPMQQAVPGEYQFAQPLATENPLNPQGYSMESGYYQNNPPIPPIASQPNQPPLQSIFIEYFTPEGTPYYYNAYSKTTTWEHPAPNCYVIYSQTPRPEPQQTIYAPPAVVPQAPIPPRQISKTPVKPPHGGHRGPPGCNVFIFHLPNDWSDQELNEHFSQFGNLVSTRVMIDKQTGRNKGYGFVSYDNAASAMRAVAEMNGYSVLGKRLKVELKKGDDEGPITGRPY